MNIDAPQRGRRLILAGWFVVLTAVGSLGCGDRKNDKGLTKVSGVVHVDGLPTEGVTITLHPRSGGGAISTGASNSEGEFEISTYQFGDGTLPGEYSVTCILGTFHPISRGMVGDRLGGIYASPSDTPIHWTIVEADDQDVGTLQLAMPGVNP